MKFLINILLLLLPIVVTAQDAKTIVKKADEIMRGNSSKSEVVIQIVRPTWQREMGVKSWAKGDDLSVILITSPAKDKGTAFLKRGKEIWNWMPSLERSIKLPPSMMSQSWMGTDFTNDDLVNQVSIVDDYSHTLLGDSTIEGRNVWKIVLIPSSDAAVVWGKIWMYVDQQDYLELKSVFFDEDGYPVNIMNASEIKEFDGRSIPSRLEMIPVDEPGNKTILIYKNFDFDIDIDDNFFSLQNIKRLR